MKEWSRQTQIARDCTPVKDKNRGKPGVTSTRQKQQELHRFAYRQYQDFMKEAKDYNDIVWYCCKEGIPTEAREQDLAEQLRAAAIWKKLSTNYPMDEYTKANLMRMAKGIEPSKHMVGEIKRELNKEREGKTSLVLINGKDVEPKEYEWVIPHWLVRNEINLLAGVAKKGKTGIALKLAAQITRGNALAEKYPCRQGKVLIWSGEDDLARTIVPRLKAMGADMDKIRFIRNIRVTKGESLEVPFYLDEDLAKLDQALLREKDVQMMVLDPITGIAANAKDGYNAIHIRKSLEPLIAMARKHHVAILGITHFKKGGQGSVLDRIIGSQAWGAVARVVLVADYLKAEEYPRFVPCAL